MSQKPPLSTRLAAGLAVITATLEILSSVVLVIMMLLTFADVIGRYVLSAPIFSASEMITALLALVIFSGLGIANARDSHIVVELFDDKIREKSPLLYDFIIQAFSVGAMTLIAYVLLEAALEAFHQHAVTVVLELPLYYVFGTVAFLAIISVISLVIGIVLKWRSVNAALKGDSP